MPDAKDFGEAARRMRDEQEFSCDSQLRSTAGAAHTSDLRTHHARLAQALRDVRHLLPAAGVVIVDEALAGVRSGDDAPIFEAHPPFVPGSRFN